VRRGRRGLFQCEFHERLVDGHRVQRMQVSAGAATMASLWRAGNYGGGAVF
jgi:hypothetical protein